MNMEARIYFESVFPNRKPLFLAAHSDVIARADYGLVAGKTKFNFSFKEVTAINDATIIIAKEACLSQNDLDYAHAALSRISVASPKALFVGGDNSHRVSRGDTLVFKGTQYKRFKQKNEIVIPPFCDDIGEQGGYIFRQKALKPTVSFCGWAGFPTSIHYAKYLLKLLLVDLKKLFFLDPTLEIFKQGLYFRRKALKAFRKQSLVETSFIVRNSFSGNTKTISLDPVLARKEYVENIKNSDFVLAPKGDANYSVRFFEALSMGRIPILIDTEVCLPFEDRVDYSKCILRVSYKDIKKLPQIVADFYAQLSEAQWIAMQKEARRVFHDHLRYDSFFNAVFENYSTEAAKNRTKIS